MFDTRRMMCNPFIIVIGFIVGLIIVCKIYYHVILDTLMIAGLSIVGILIAFGIGVFIHSSFKWNRSRPIVSPDAEPEPEPVLTDEQKITAEADWLASGIELAFSPDGKTLIYKDERP